MLSFISPIFLYLNQYENFTCILNSVCRVIAVFSFKTQSGGAPAGTVQRSCFALKPQNTRARLFKTNDVVS